MERNRSVKVRKKEIIAKARELFLQQGFDETSISQIAKSLGVAKGLLYYYFEKKEDVLHSVIDDMCQEQIDHLKMRIASSDGSFCESLLILVDEYVVVHLMLSHSRQKPDVFESKLIHEFHIQYLTEIQNVIYEIVEVGNKEGLIVIEHPDVMLVMILEGIFSAGVVALHDNATVCVLLEQALHLPKHSLESLGIIHLHAFNEYKEVTSFDG